MPITVVGLRETQAAFAEIAPEFKAGIRDELQQAAEPIKTDATFNAQSAIRHIGPVWSQMRVGVTQTEVYVAPKARRRGGSPRPNLVGLLMDKAMQPALDSNTDGVIAAVEKFTDRLGLQAGF